MNVIHPQAARPKQKIRLRALLILLAFIAVAPGVAINLYTSLVLQRDALLRAQQEIDSVARLVAANQDQLIGGVRQILTTVASGPSVRRNDLRVICGEYLRNVKAASPGYAAIGLFDLQGNMECESGASVVRVRDDQQPLLRQVAESGKFQVGDYQNGVTPGRDLLDFAMPVYDYDSQLRGVAFATLDLDFFATQLKSVSLSERFHIRISDSGGHLLFSSGNVRDPIGTPDIEQVIRTQLPTSSNNPFMTTDVHGAQWLHVQKWVSGDALVVDVSVLQSDLVAVANQQLIVQFVLLAAASLFGFLLAWLIARRSLEQPVARLLERMHRAEQDIVGNADNDLPATPPANAEFAELDAGFSSMLAKLRSNQRQLIEAQEITRVGFYAMDLVRREYTASPILFAILGLDTATERISQDDYERLIHPDDLAQVRQRRTGLVEGKTSSNMQYRIIRPDGGVRWIDVFGVIERDAAGKAVRYSGAIQDITERKLAEQAALANENRFRLLFENSLDGVVHAYANGMVLAANSAACKIFGMTEEQLCSHTRADLVFSGDTRLAAMLVERATSGNTRGELTMVRGDGSLFEAELTSSLYTDANGIEVTSLVMRDSTERIRTEREIHQLAFFDALTELPNRRLLLDRLSLLLASAQRSGEIGGVLFIDLDHFKNVNDARGHATGDALLRLVAQRLAGLLRTEDTVARIGGDEFVVLLPRLAADMLTGTRQSMAVAEKIREALSRPFLIDGQSYLSGGSIGVTLLPKPGQTTEDLLREADTAMYRAKSAGRNRIAFFEAAMQSDVEQRLALENDLAEAIGTDQLEMFLQPQFDAAGQPDGCEMLMRWTHPVRGPVSPAVFIPAAEESGLILPLGDWVLREGCRTVLRLQEAGHPLPVSINVSPRQFRQIDFAGQVKAILAETGADASQLIFEVTEGLLIENLEETILRMHELVSIGIRFSIDDFGTGYSSLGYLRRLPLYELKIDRSFVQDTPGNPDNPGDTAIVQTILSMAGHLGLRVVAEGVETREQADFLKAAGCTALQGYLLARPMPVAAWLQWQ
ncbi:bifunctional diguanylate cyclase/phosphodiesterase [Actimicrobium antarcticum]|uniref:PAS domain S-box-containing protein/diguanylate cyclase (GGDEF) domain-containing protein n=1 Tax=Actimicrobium antarcticum TaxID=1051899 RepID=A0ABP7SKP4_9BURK